MFLDFDYEKTSGYAVLFLRVVLGYILFYHVYHHTVGFAIPGVHSVFSMVGMDAFSVMFTYWVGVVFAVMLVLGLYTKWSSFVAALYFLGAVFTYYANGFFYMGAGGGWEYPFVLFVGAVGLMLMGHGHYAAGTFGGLMDKVTSMFK